MTRDELLDALTVERFSRYERVVHEAMPYVPEDPDAERHRRDLVTAVSTLSSHDSDAESTGFTPVPQGVLTANFRCGQQSAVNGHQERIRKAAR